MQGSGNRLTKALAKKGSLYQPRAKIRCRIPSPSQGSMPGQQDLVHYITDFIHIVEVLIALE